MGMGMRGDESEREREEREERQAEVVEGLTD